MKPCVHRIDAGLRKTFNHLPADAGCI